MSRQLSTKTLFYALIASVVCAFSVLVALQSSKKKQQNTTLKLLGDESIPLQKEEEKITQDHQSFDKKLKFQQLLLSKKIAQREQLQEELAEFKRSLAKSNKQLSILSKERLGFLKLSESIKRDLSSLGVTDSSQLDKKRKSLSKDVQNKAVKVARLKNETRKLTESSDSEEASFLQASILSINIQKRFIIIDKGLGDKVVNEVGDKLLVKRNGAFIREVTLAKVYKTHSICDFIPNLEKVAHNLRVGDQVFMTLASRSK